MPNPTRQEIIEAHNALGELRALAEDSLQSDTATIRTLGEHIVTVLPPRPRPTMAEVEWDDDKHYLAEAEHSAWGKVVMLRESALIIFVQPIEKRMGDIHVARVEELTPTGKRYTLTEVQE